MQSRFSIMMAVLAISVPIAAEAQSLTTGAIQGRVTDKDSGEALAGVTITVSGPALIEPQTAFTDEDGRYKITELPPGDYKVTFYVDDRTTLDRTGIRVGANDTTPVFEAIKVGETIEIRGRPPQVNVTSTARAWKYERDYLEHVPLPSRTADGAAGASAGANNDGVGIAISGSTSLENRYLVDGIDITGLTFGDVGTPILNDFVQEIEVLTGGYNAEWGRAIGGIVNIVTKSGSNQFKGSVFGTVSPGLLTASRETAPSNASSIDVTADRAYSADFGVELGGPIIKDRLWFYAGLAPRLDRTDLTRTTKRQTDCRRLLPTGALSGCDPRLASLGGYADGEPDVDPQTGFFITDELDREVRSSTTRQLSSIAKLNLAVTPKHQAQWSLITVPARTRSPGVIGLPSSGGRASTLTWDTAVRWTSKLNGDRTEIEALAAWHHSRLDTGSIDASLDGDPRQILFGGNLGTWSALGGESRKTIDGCTDGGGADPYGAITNCPMDSLGYATGGPGGIARDREDRRAVRLSVTQRARLAGTHELKAGLDYEDNRKVATRLFSGGAFLQNFVGRQIDVTRWVQLAGADETDPRFDQMCNTPDPDGTTGMAKTFRCDFLGGVPGAPGTEVAGQTLNWAAYLRDSWQPRSNLTINAGLRYEEQRMSYAASLRDKADPLTGNIIGKTAMDLRGNLAPRLGVVYDPTEVGLSKIYGSWGRFFEAIPMDINDRSFGGEVSFRQTFTPASQQQPCGPSDPKLGGANGLGCLDPDATPASEQLIGSSGVLVAPGIKAQYLDELLVGTEYQLAEDLKVGLAYVNRKLGRVIEDVSTDGAATYVIANPGEFSASEESTLEERLARTDDSQERARLQKQLDLFRGIRRFDRPARNYHALEMTVSKRMSRGLFVQASYTFSRTEGNFPGSISYDNGQIDPNISSQYDLVELLANRRGPLPQDRPHSIKLDGFYRFDLGKLNALTAGTRIRVISGIPENALGAHYLYGADESFLLPRGRLGRTELEHGVDLHVAYARRLPRKMALEVYANLFNLYNRQGEFNVDATYAPQFRQGGGENNVNPISGGTYEDLMWAKTIDGDGGETSLPTARNPNFRRTTTRYAPAAVQLGFRLTF